MFMPDFIRPDNHFEGRLRKWTHKDCYFENIHGIPTRFEAKKSNFEEWTNSDYITILNWSGLSPFRGIPKTRLSSLKIFGKRYIPAVGQMDCHRYPRSKCFHPILDESGKVIADYEGNLVAIHFDVLHANNEVARAVLIYVLHKAGILSEEAVKDLSILFSYTLIDRMAEAYNDWKSSQKARIQKDIASYQKHILNYQKEIETYYGYLKDAHLRIIQIKDVKELTPAEVRKSILKAKKLPYIKSIKISKYQMKVVFKPVTLNGVKLGTYVLTIDTGLADKIHNRFLKDKTTTYDRKVYQHPQIYESGQICLGSLEMLRVHLFNGHIDLFLEGAWQLLNNYNLRDSHCKWGNFLTAFNFLKKHPKSKFPGFMFNPDDDDYYSPEAVETAIKQREQGL